MKKRPFISFWVIGLFAFVWFLLRSGTNPKRLMYPCQQAAYPLASAWFIAVTAPIAWGNVGRQTDTLIKRYGMQIIIASAALVVINTVAIPMVRDVFAFKPMVVAPYESWESSSPVSEIFLFEDIPASEGSLAAGDATVDDDYLNDLGIDSLVLIMESNGTYFHKTNDHPTGIVGADDIVIIKANFQWRGRLSTNTDRIKGVIWQVLNHPDGFTGEIIIADNGSEQEQPSVYFCGFTDYANNSDDTDQSIVDVVNTFKAKGYAVDTMAWDNLNTNIVDEYDQSDLESGYVYNSTTKINYPKFVSPEGEYVSLRYGIWDNVAEEYDLSRLTIINMPVLKAHEMGGATVAVKNWVGVMNNIYTTSWYGGYNEFHNNYVFDDFALPAKMIDAIYPKLNIIDATYTATRNNYEPGSPATKTNTILASTDPIAADWYATKHILTPIASYPNNTNPDYTGGTGDTYYHNNMEFWTDYLQYYTSRVVTKDSASITVYAVMGEDGGLSTYRYLQPEGKRYIIDGVQKVIKLLIQ